ncbi:hypothetical protein E5338_01025 [Limosilactobacillus reuteri]|nr:hypothetical protein E5338_01025 [Limosilactobacillus reuteri]
MLQEEALRSVKEVSASLGSAYFLTSIRMSNRISSVKLSSFMGITSSQFTREVIPIFCCQPTPNSS